MLYLYESKFKNILGNPTTKENLKDYLEFIMSKKDIVYEYCVYTEKHHIFPRSLFEDESIIILDYIDHVEAHVLLAKAYPIRKFLRPLNFMLSRNEKEIIGYNSMLSEHLKLWWKEFKKTEKYEIWSSKKSEEMTIKMVNGLASYLSNKRFSNIKEREKVSIQFKTLWEDIEYRKKLTNSIQKYRSSEEGRLKCSEASLKGWEKDSENKKNKLRIIQKEFNNETAEKNKKLWATAEYREKMSKRKKGNNSNTLKKLWADPIWKAKTLESRKNKRKLKNETN